MSTKINGFGETLVVLNDEGTPSDPQVGIFIHSCMGREAAGDIPRADFLAAVESELGVKVVPADAVVIERSELPEVTPSDGGFGVGPHFVRAGNHEIAASADVALVREHAAALLSIAEYLAAQPPVDQAQVEAFVADLASTATAGGADKAAVQMVAKGWRKDGA